MHTLFILLRHWQLLGSGSPVEFEVRDLLGWLIHSSACDVEHKRAYSYLDWTVADWTEALHVISSSKANAVSSSALTTARANSCETLMLFQNTKQITSNGMAANCWVWKIQKTPHHTNQNFRLDILVINSCHNGGSKAVDSSPDAEHDSCTELVSATVNHVVLDASLIPFQSYRRPIGQNHFQALRRHLISISVAIVTINFTLQRLSP